MKLIFTTKNPVTDIHSIDIFSPTRGVFGTLSYAVRVNEILTSFEMNDEGDWASTCGQILFSNDVLSLINELISNEEDKRLRLVQTP